MAFGDIRRLSQVNFAVQFTVQLRRRYFSQQFFYFGEPSQRIPNSPLLY